MFEIKTAQSKASTAEGIWQDLQQQLTGQQFQFGFVMGHHSRVPLLRELPMLSCAAHWIGGSSCLGVITEQGVFLQQDSLAVLMIRDDEGHYASASAVIENQDIAKATQQALTLALQKAGRPYQVPELVWCMQPPGTEEAVLRQIEKVLGKKVPVYGGSSADDDVSGLWVQYDGHAIHQQAVVIAVLYPSVAISHFFHSGYIPTQHKGIVTKAKGRLLQEIDGQPAVDVYSSWLNKKISANYMQETTLTPLGSIIAQDQLDLPLYLLSLPLDFHDDGTIELFAEVEQGTQLCLMTSETPRLLGRTGTMCDCTRSILPQQRVSGGIIIFCGACLLSIKEQMALVRDNVCTSLDGAPFLIAFTFGEQGYAVDHTNRHGNLMYATVLFGETDADS
jgi:hypothetical protein